MKITKVSACPVGVVIPRPGNPAPRRNWIFVRVETDEGLVGLGEATTEHYEHAVLGMVNDQFGPYLVGKDPTQITRLWQEMQRLFWWRGGVVGSSAASGVEQALWDITGKAYGQPVYKLLGGAVRDHIPCYTHTGDPAVARELMQKGWRAFKSGP